MPLGMIMAGGALAGSLIGGVGSFFSGKSAQDKQEELLKELGRKLNMSIQEIENINNVYVNTLQDLQENFDIYDMEDAFASLYEGVIQPMERDFDENVIPSIQEAYSSGIMGGGAGMSGAQAEAESKAHRGLNEQKAGLRYQERGQAINRNIGERAFQAGTAGSIRDAQSQAPQLRMQADQMMYTGQSSNIASSLQNQQNLWNMPGNALSAAMGGYSMGTSIMGQQNLNKFLKNYNDREPGSSNTPVTDYFDQFR